LGGYSYRRVLKALAKNIRKRRARLRISQVELARRMQTSQNQVSLLERQQHEPLLGTLAKLADALECSVSTLLREGEGGSGGRIDGVRRRAKRRERAQQAEVARQDDVCGSL
jgi:transcriptional regulator with XRE-family HTH domain